MSTLAELIPLLPAEVPARAQDLDSRIHTFTTGAYVRGGIHGPRCNLTNFPATSMLLAILLRCACPKATFTSLALLCNQDAILHRDLNNALDSMNFALPLSSFEGGGIWVEGSGDESPPKPSTDPRVGLGSVLSLAEGPVSFDSHKWHCTMPWVRLLVGFTVKGYSEFPPELVQSLQDAAFALPATCTADVFCRQPQPTFPVLIELFSGLGRLTAQARTHGAPGSLAVDSLATESAAAAPMVLDVVDNLALLRDWLLSPYIVCLHAARRRAS